MSNLNNFDFKGNWAKGRGMERMWNVKDMEWRRGRGMERTWNGEENVEWRGGCEMERRTWNGEEDVEWRGGREWRGHGYFQQSYCCLFRETQFFKEDKHSMSQFFTVQNAHNHVFYFNSDKDKSHFMNDVKPFISCLQ